VSGMYYLQHSEWYVVPATQWAACGTCNTGSGMWCLQHSEWEVIPATQRVDVVPAAHAV
jgi:hypothetical protein